MKHLLLALAAVASFGEAQARHAGKMNGAMKGSDTVSIVNKTNRSFEKVIFELQFAGVQPHGARNYGHSQSYVTIHNLKAGASAKANLLNAVTDRCNYPHHRGASCGESTVAKHYGNDPKNVESITIRHISAGKADTYVSRMKAQGGFVRPFTASKGTMARNFEIVPAKGDRIVIRPIK
jgi:hypothetical protein